MRDLGGDKFGILSVRASKRSRLHFDDLILGPWLHQNAAQKSLRICGQI